MSSVFNEALERASNPKMPPPKSPIRTPTSPSRTSSMFQGKIKETVITIPGPSSSSKCRPSTPRPIPVEDRDIYASGALPPVSFSPSNTATATGLPDEIPIPKFKTPSNLSYTSNYPEDEVDWSEPTPPLPPSHLGSGPCRNFRDPQAAADEERARHFAQHRQQRLQKLVSASDALRDARALPDAVGAEAECDPLEALCEFDSTSHMVSGGFGSGTHMLAGEIGSVYVPGAWRSQSKASPAEDDLFSDVAESGGDTDDDDDDDDEEQWDAEFARAEEELVDGDGDRKIGEGRYTFSYENGGLSTWRAERAAAPSQGAGKDAAPISAPSVVAAAAPYVKPKQAAVKNQHEGENETRVPDRYGDSINESIGENVRKPQGATHVPTPDSGTAVADPVAAPYIKHTSLTTTRDWAYPATLAPSPTESQLLASGFEFHNELSEKEQIALFGDKAFRKALREVLPSLSRKQQWYAWRRVNEENYGEGTASKEILKEEAKEGSGGCECKCPGNGEECDGDDGTCGKLLSERLCGDCGDCDEHYLWHHPDGACETEGGLGEPPGDTHVQRSVSGKGRREGGDGQTEWLGQDCKCSKKRDHVNREADGERDTFTSDCGRGGDGANRPCPPGRYACKDCWKSRAQHHRPVLNPEVSDRPSDWTGLFSHGRLADGEPVSQVRQGLDVGHDVPAAPVSRIPGLGLLDQSSNVQPSHDQVRRSVEPEMPRRQMHRESTPAYENRSPSPSPIDRREDIEMTDAPSTTALPLGSRLSLPQPTSSPDSISSPTHAVTAPETPARPRSRSRSRSRSPVKAPIPALETPKTTKRGGRRKSAVQGSKVEKTSTTKGRAVSRTVTTAVKNAAEKAGNKVKEAVARIEASVKAQDENTPRRSARIRAKMQREATPKE